MCKVPTPLTQQRRTCNPYPLAIDLDRSPLRHFFGLSGRPKRHSHDPRFPFTTRISTLRFSILMVGGLWGPDNCLQRGILWGGGNTPLGKPTNQSATTPTGEIPHDFTYENIKKAKENSPHVGNPANFPTTAQLTIFVQQLLLSNFWVSSVISN